MELSESSTMDLIDELRERMSQMSPLERGEVFEEVIDGYRYVPSLLIEDRRTSQGRLFDEPWEDEPE